MHVPPSIFGDSEELSVNEVEDRFTNTLNEDEELNGSPRTKSLPLHGKSRIPMGREGASILNSQAQMAGDSLNPPPSLKDLFSPALIASDLCLDSLQPHVENVSLPLIKEVLPQDF